MKKIIRLTEEELQGVIKEAILERAKEYNERKVSFRKMHHAPTSLNEDVMKRFWNIDYQSAPVLVEHITIDRLMKKHGDNGFVIVSANRSDKSQEYNDNATASLVNDLKSSGFSYLPVYGGYKGEDGVTDNYEPSFVIFNYDTKGNPTDWNTLNGFALKLCGKYSQDSVYINRPGEAPEYHNANGEKVNKTSSKDYEKNNHQNEFFTSFISPEEVAKHGKTQPIGRRFTSDIVFEGKLYLNPIPSSATAKMRRKGEIMAWQY